MRPGVSYTQSTMSDPDPFDDDRKRAWQSSDAKAALYAAIEEGEIPIEPGGDEAEGGEVLWDYFCLRPEVHNYGEFNTYFKRRRNDLRKQVKKGRSRSEEDLIAYQWFIKNNPKSTMAANGDYPEWEGHRAQELLKRDMAAGKHKTMSPKDLRLEEPEYQEFPLDVFRSHIYQEFRTEKWMNYLKGARKGDRWKEFVDKDGD